LEKQFFGIISLGAFILEFSCRYEMRLKFGIFCTHVDLFRKKKKNVLFEELYVFFWHEKIKSAIQRLKMTIKYLVVWSRIPLPI
jgi:hypothetical protein